jgi:predicted dehydrogenase
LRGQEVACRGGGRNMNAPRCRWGILGTASIARKNWRAIRNAPNCTLAAVASRDLERCRRFVAECQQCVPYDAPPRCYGSYDQLLADDAVNAVYLPLPTGVRKPWAIRAAEAGKHVLVEKPVGVSAADVRDILAACARSGVQFMDGVMFMHNPRLRQIRAALDDGHSIGQVRRIVSQFTFRAPDEAFAGDIRAMAALEPLGCLGDLGWYNIRFALWVLNGALPTRVCAHALASLDGPDMPAALPTDFTAELFFADGASAAFYCSFLTEHQQWANVSGSGGFVHVPDFVLPYHGGRVAFEVSNAVFDIRGCDFNMEEHTRRVLLPEGSQAAEQAQETHMFHTFAELVLSGRRDASWGRWALDTQRVLDACLESARSGGQIVTLDA